MSKSQEIRAIVVVHVYSRIKGIRIRIRRELQLEFKDSEKLETEFWDHTDTKTEILKY